MDPKTSNKSKHAIQIYETIDQPLAKKLDSYEHKIEFLRSPSSNTLEGKHTQNNKRTVSLDQNKFIEFAANNKN